MRLVSIEKIRLELRNPLQAYANTIFHWQNMSWGKGAEGRVKTQNMIEGERMKI